MITITIEEHAQLLSLLQDALGQLDASAAKSKWGDYRAAERLAAESRTLLANAITGVAALNNEEA